LKPNVSAVDSRLLAVDWSTVDGRQTTVGRYMLLKKC
jgi:hypothetical protein